MPRNDDWALRPLPLVPHAQKFHRAVGDHDAEGGADGAFDELDAPAMCADEFGRDRKAKAAAAGAAGALERLEQVLARLGRNARAGIGDFQDRDRAFAAAGDADLERGGIALRTAL